MHVPNTDLYTRAQAEKGLEDGVERELLHTLRDRSRSPDARTSLSGRRTSFLSNSAYRHTDFDHAEWVFLHSVHFGTCDV